MKKINLFFTIIGLLFIPALILALETEPTIKEYYTNYNSIGAYGKFQYAGQTFTATTDYKITGVKILAKRLGEPIGTITIGIRATDIAGKPTGSNFCSGTMNGSEINNTIEQWYLINLTGINCNLEENVKYAIIISSNGDASKLGLARHLTGTYLGGSYFESYDYGATWTETITRDYAFETWGMATKVIPVGNDFIINAMAYVGDVWTDFKLIAILGMGLPVGFYIVKKIITIF